MKSAFLELGDEGAEGGFGVAEEHAGVGHEKEAVLYACKSGREATF